jgi:energy-converting hydrogenase A subunit I
MVNQKSLCIVLLIISTISILACLVMNFEAWIVYLVAIIGIPLWVLSFGLLTMAKPREEDKEERVKEPFTGY